MKSEEDIDNIFKKGMQDPENHRVYNEDDWDALEQLLDGGKKRRGIVFWLPVLSAAAAILILCFGWWFFKPTVTVDNATKGFTLKKAPVQQNSQGTNNQTTAQQAATNNNTNTQTQLAGTTNSKTIQQNTADVTDNTVQHNNTVQQSKSAKSHLSQQKYLAATNGGKNVKENNAVVVYGNNYIQSGNNAPTNTYTASLAHDTTKLTAAHVNSSYLAASLLDGRGTFADIASPDFEELANREIIADGLANTKRETTKLNSANHKQFALTVLASSDVNGVNSFNEYSMVGTSFGALFTTSGIFNKFSITTGVVYSSKPYAASVATYNSKIELKWVPLGVTADCKMLDIPINLGYQLFKNQHNKISVGTGLSSYLMLNEKYSYTYSGSHPNWPQSYTVPHSKDYFMSLVNINATYERKLNSKFGLSVQPYFKLPITGIGYSDAKLESAGLAVGLIWNINSFKKQ